MRHTEKTLNEKLSADDRVKTRRGPEDATFDDDIPARVNIFSPGFYFKVFYIFHDASKVFDIRTEILHPCKQIAPFFNHALFSII